MIEAKIIADSISPARKRLTTFVVKYHRYVHCFDEETEYLSQIHNEVPRFRSFLAIKTLQCKVAQYNQDTGSISFIHPLNIVESIFTGDMIQYESRKFSMCVTDQHRIFSLRRTTKNQYLPHTDLAMDWTIKYSGHRRILQAASLETSYRTYHNPLEAKLIAYYVADGHATKTQAEFHFRKQRKVDSVCSLLDQLGIQYTIRRYDKDVVILFDKPIWISDCYTDNGQKKYPEFLFHMTTETFESFKEGTLESDGNTDNCEINTTSSEAVHQIQTLALLNNTAMNIRSYSQNGYSNIYKQKYQVTPHISFRSDKDFFSRQNVTNKSVYCFTTETSYLVVRRKGVAYISGNCELLTHRVFSRNSASSRAIRIEKMISSVLDDPAIPLEWGTSKKGMQPGPEVDAFTASVCETQWLDARDQAVKYARQLADMGIAKQICNRLLEPFSYITTIITATEFDNFFDLRLAAPAQAEIRELARLMHQVYSANRPTRIEFGGWHLPFIKDSEKSAPGTFNKRGKLRNEEVLIKASVARCARVSYLTHDNQEPKLDMDISLHDRLVADRHFSPTEHIAQPLTNPNEQSANFYGWIQYRQMLPNQNCKHFIPPKDLV